MKTKAGWNEVRHTADRSIHVLAPDLEGLFRQSVYGMYGVMGIKPVGPPVEQKILEMAAFDIESLLVLFLSEILSFLEVEKLIFCEISMQTNSEKYEFKLAGFKAENVRVAIKAVTFHDLKIEQTSNGYETTIVFDV